MTEHNIDSELQSCRDCEPLPDDAAHVLSLHATDSYIFECCYGSYNGEIFNIVSFSKTPSYSMPPVKQYAVLGYTHFPPYATFFFQLVALGILRLVFLIIQWRRKASKKERSNVETSEQAALLLHATFSSSSSYITEVQQVYQQLRQFLKQKSEHYETLFASTGHPSRPSASEQWENRDTSRRNLPTVKKRVESRAYYLSVSLAFTDFANRFLRPDKTPVCFF